MLLRSIAEAKAQAAVWRNHGRMIGLTNGCFDLIHVGHVSTLAFARQNCDRLIVAIDNDESVRKLKGSPRPVNTSAHRALIVGSLRYVDAVLIFSHETLAFLVAEISPNVLIKGADYEVSGATGWLTVSARGGRVLYAPMVDEVSTTALIDAIKSAPA